VLPVNIVITGILKAPKNTNYGFSLAEFGFETLRVLLPTDTNTNIFHFTVIFAIDCNHQGEFEVMDIKFKFTQVPCQSKHKSSSSLDYQIQCPDTLLICLTSVLTPSFFKVGIKLIFYTHLNNLTVNLLQACIQSIQSTTGGLNKDLILPYVLSITIQKKKLLMYI